MSNSADENLCKIFGAEAWHSPVEIIASPEALRELRDAIDEALDEGTSKASMFESDGEGYSVYIVKEERSWADWCKLPCHYTDREFTGGDDNEKWVRLYKLLEERIKRIK